MGRAHTRRCIGGNEVRLLFRSSKRYMPSGPSDCESGIETRGNVRTQREVNLRHRCCRDREHPSPKSPKVFIPYASEGPAPTVGVGRGAFGAVGGATCSARSHGGERMKSSISSAPLVDPRATTAAFWMSSFVGVHVMITVLEGHSVCPRVMLPGSPKPRPRSAAAGAPRSGPRQQQHRSSPIETATR